MVPACVARPLSLSRVLVGLLRDVSGTGCRIEAPEGVAPGTEVSITPYGYDASLEFRIGANFGGYRFRRDGHSDTAGFFEFQGEFGVRPNEFVWIGITARSITGRRLRAPFVD